MDLFYYAIYYVSLFLTPLVCYFLIYGGRSLYSDRDWFYLIKLYTARKEVLKYKKFYQAEAKILGKNIEIGIDIPNEKHTNCQYFYGTDQKGNSLSLKLTLGLKNVAETCLHLRLADGNTYTFPGESKSILTTLAKQQWKANGLNIEVLEPFRRLRITFNGLLRNESIKEHEKMEHIQLNFIFTSSGRPSYIPQDIDTLLLSNALTTETWRDASWKDNLADQSGFEQFGALHGFLKGDRYSNEYLLNLPTCRSKLRGIDDRFLMKRVMKIFIVDTYGNMINVVIKSFSSGCPQLNYGCVFSSNNKLLPLKGIDIRLKNIATHKVNPELITMHLDVKGTIFKCVIHLNKLKTLKSSNDGKYGYECFNVPAECNINTNQGRALVEFWYKNEGISVFIPTHKLCEKTFDVFPNVLVSDIRNEDSQILELTGGKGNSLALLATLDSKDFIVPDGFIVTVNAYRLQLQFNKELIKSITVLNDICCGKKSSKLEDACNETVNLFKSEKLQPDIASAIIGELHKYFGDKNFGWAVRSSAIGEDSEELSAAGQNETFLGCLDEEQILKSVCECWASQFTYQSVQYRWQHGLPIASDIAVVVQKMVPAASAGVLFTCHPSTSNPSQMIITSNFGLGETVVSGQSDPDTYILNRKYNDEVCIIDKHIGAKNKILKMTSNGVEEAQSETEEDWSITEEQAIHLGKVGVYLETAFGNPRDIEWAFYKDKLFLLQSRPITTLNTWTDYELTHEMDSPVFTEKTVFTMANVREVIPNAATVLSQTSSLQIQDRAMQIHALQNEDAFSNRTILYFQHNAFLDVINAIHKNISKEIELSSVILDLAIFGHPVLDENIQNIVMNRLGLTSNFAKLKESFRILACARRNKATRRNAKEFVDKLNLDVEGNETVWEVYKKIESSFDDILKVSICHTEASSVSVLYQILSMVILLEKEKELTTDHYSDFALILSSCDDVVSAEVPKYLEKIANLIKKDCNDQTFSGVKPEHGVKWMESNCPEAYTLFEEFLQKHGHRSLGEFEMFEESWAENQSKVISMIQANIKHGRSIGKTELSVDEVMKKLAKPKSAIARNILKYIIKKIREAVGIREQTKSELVRAFNKLRLAYRHLSQQMVLQGILPSKDLLYHLTHEEIGQIIQKRNPLLVTKAIRRQRLYPKWNKLKFPEINYGIPIPASETELRRGSFNSKCKGTAVCNGTVEARACVINSLEEIDQLQTGDILITYCTDIGWSPYFPMLSGIVTELGGLVSHGAVVAREYGLPCIVGVKDCTKCFETGDMVFLNGTSGELARL